MLKDNLPGLVRFLRPAPGTSFISYSRIDPDRLDEVIQTQVADLCSRGLRFSWTVYDHDSPAGLKAALEKNGFQPEEPGDIMVLPMDQIPPELLEPATVDLRVITSPEGIEDVIRVEEQVWGGNFNWMRERLSAHLAIPGYLHLLVAYLEGVPVCTGWTYYPPNSQFAGLWGGSTVEAYRGRGLYTAVLAARVQEAHRRGTPYLYVEAEAMSRPIVARHGFQYLDTTRSYQYMEQEKK